MQLLYNDVAVAIGLTYSFLPFMILPVYSVFEKFDWRLVEAAHDLGAMVVILSGVIAITLAKARKNKPVVEDKQ